MKYLIGLIAILLWMATLIGNGRMLHADTTAYPTYTPVAATPILIETSQPTATLDPASFDISTASTFKASNDSIEILLPRGWANTYEDAFGSFQFSYGTSSNSVRLEILIGQPEDVYGPFFGPSLSFNSPRAALEWVKTNSSLNDVFEPQDIHPITIGKFSGLGLAASQLGNQQEVASGSEMRIASLPDGKLVLILMGGRQPIWNKAQRVLYKMLDNQWCMIGKQ